MKIFWFFLLLIYFSSFLSQTEFQYNLQTIIPQDKHFYAMNSVDDWMDIRMCTGEYVLWDQAHTN